MSKLISTLMAPCDAHCPHSSCLLSAIRGMRNGAVYGAKIRFPHALVMTLLFKRDSPQKMLRTILRATYQHSRNLATFAVLYKSMVCLMRRFQGKEAGMHAFLSAGLAGYYVFGENNAINQQICFYLFSRIAMATVRSGIARDKIQYTPRAWPVFASLMWAIVLTQFEYDGNTLQSSLFHSMDYIYHQSDKWSTWRDFLI